MRFEFDELRAAQAAAVLLRLAGGRQNYTWLLKVLYLADRESLREVGAPIAGASFCNMNKGPLASDVYRRIKKDGDYPRWDQHFRTVGFDLLLTADPGDSELSEFDVELLTGLYEKYRKKDYLEMIDLVHKLSEWIDPGSSSLTLHPEQIMKAAGVPKEEIERLEALNAHVNGVSRLLT